MSRRTHLPDDGLSEWIRQHPEVWGDAVAAPSPDMIDDAVHRVVSGAHVADRTAEWGRRRRRAFAGGVAAFAVVTGSALGVAAVIRSGQPTRPNEGIACRASADTRADAIVIDAAIDPVAACAALWSEGRFSPAGSEASVPELTACVGAGGLIEVLPGASDVCAQLGLVASDSTLTPGNEAILRLNDRLVNEINLADCAPATEVADAAQRLLDESGLVDWTVTIRPDSVGATCAKTALDAPTRTITVIRFP